MGVLKPTDSAWIQGMQETTIYRYNVQYVYYEFHGKFYETKGCHLTVHSTNELVALLKNYIK